MLPTRTVSTRSLSGNPTTLSYDVNQGTWVELLRTMGYADRMLLEVPAPGSIQNPQLKDAVDQLRQAHQHLLEGRWRDAVGSCRDVVEALGRGIGDGDEVDRVQVPAPLFENTRQMDKAGRLRVLRRALKVLTHPARHRDEVAVNIEWTPSDARAVVSMMAALLSQFDGA
ncbi:MAG: hypothetical protein HYZ28_16375 [Myxococcales bacterium]|nr:hypothetical protein [Myxococcales bacterium]